MLPAGPPTARACRNAQAVSTGAALAYIPILHQPLHACGDPYMRGDKSLQPSRHCERLVFHVECKVRVWLSYVSGGCAQRGLRGALQSRSDLARDVRQARLQAVAPHRAHPRCRVALGQRARPRALALFDILHGARERASGGTPVLPDWTQCQKPVDCCCALRHASVPQHYLHGNRTLAAAHLLGQPLAIEPNLERPIIHAHQPLRPTVQLAAVAQLIMHLLCTYWTGMGSPPAWAAVRRWARPRAATRPRAPARPRPAARARRCRRRACAGAPSLPCRRRRRRRRRQSQTRSRLTRRPSGCRAPAAVAAHSTNISILVGAFHITSSST